LIFRHQGIYYIEYGGKSTIFTQKSWIFCHLIAESMLYGRKSTTNDFNDHAVAGDGKQEDDPGDEESETASRANPFRHTVYQRNPYGTRLSSDLSFLRRRTLFSSFQNSMKAAKC
jgi:hypothetical protein